MWYFFNNKNRQFLTVTWHKLSSLWSTPYDNLQYMNSIVLLFFFLLILLHACDLFGCWLLMFYFFSLSSVLLSCFLHCCIVLLQFVIFTFWWKTNTHTTPNDLLSTFVCVLYELLLIRQWAAQQWAATMLLLYQLLHRGTCILVVLLVKGPTTRTTSSECWCENKIDIKCNRPQ